MSEEITPRRGDRHRALVLVGAMAALMWIVEVIDQIAGGALERYGIEPHRIDGLVGIATAPFLHAGFAHLIGNTIPFLVLGATIALSGLMRVLATTAIVAVVGGLGTWLVASSGSDHIGASGLVFGYATYLIARGFFSRSKLHGAIGVAVLGFYGGSLLLAAFPADGISWQGHIFGGVGGVVAARVLERRRGRASERAGAPLADLS